MKTRRASVSAAKGRSARVAAAAFLGAAFPLESIFVDADAANQDECHHEADDGEHSGNRGRNAIYFGLRVANVTCAIEKGNADSR